MTRLKSYLYWVFAISFAFKAQANNPDTLKLPNHEIRRLLLEYPTNELIGFVGNSKMGWTKDSVRRDFGIKKRVRIKILSIEETEINRRFMVSGKTWIWNDSIRSFKGTIELKNHDTWERERDSVVIFNEKGKVSFTYENGSLLKGDILYTILKTNNEYSISNDLELLCWLYTNTGNYNCNFGYITPRSSGIFRCKTCTKIEPLCMNKALLELGWDSYVFTNPTNFDCLFDPFTDEIEDIENISISKKDLKKYNRTENRIWWK